MSLLSNLPLSLSHNILSTWLVHQDYARLDIAHCGNADRATFLEMLARTEIKEIEIYDNHFTNKLQWILMRKVICSSFKYPMMGRLSPADVAVLDRYFVVNAAHLRRVRLSTSHTETSTLLRLMALHALRLSTFTVLSWDRISRHAPWDSSFGTILHNSAAILTELTVQSRVSFRTHMAGGIHFPSLRTIDITSEKEEDLLALFTAALNLVNVTLTNPVCSGTALAAMAEHCAGIQYFAINCRIGYIVESIDEGITAMAMSCTKLKVLRLKVCDELSDIGLTAVATHCTQLEELVITENNLITDAPLIALAHSPAAKNLKHLGLAQCPQVHPTSVLAIVKHCPGLHSLDLEDTWQYGDVCMIIPHLRNLKEFSLRRTEVSDLTLHLIATHMRSLQCLNVAPQHEPAFTTECLEHLVRRCGALKSLRVSYYDFRGNNVKAEGWVMTDPGLYQRAGTY